MSYIIGKKEKLMSKEVVLKDDFLSRDTSGGLGWTALAGSGGGVAISTSLLDTQHPGIITTRCAAGSSSAWASLSLSPCFLLSGKQTYIEALVYCSHARVFGVEDIRLIFGFGNSTSLTFVEGVYFVGSTTWLARTEKNNILTQTDTHIAIAKETWYKLGILIALDYTKAEFFINDVLVATINTNLPDAEVMPLLGMNRVLVSGVETIKFCCDYVYLKYLFELER